MTLRDYEATIKEVDGKRHLAIPGIDWGYANPVYIGLLIIKETEHYYLCRKNGCGYRLSLGTQGYAPPNYIIFEKIPGGVKKPLGDWELEYTKETMKDAKIKALWELEHRENIYEV